jgi:ketosteroid isomerase-like protein
MNQTLREDTAQQLNKLVEEWAAAERRGDTAFLARTLADDFVGVGPRGFLLPKEEWLQRHQSGALQYETFTWEESLVRVYGEAAVLVGRQTQTGTYQGQDIQGQFRTTLIWVLQQGQWRLAGLQLSPILPPPVTPPGR